MYHVRYGRKQKSFMLGETRMDDCINKRKSATFSWMNYTKSSMMPSVVDVNVIWHPNATFLYLFPLSNKRMSCSHENSLWRSHRATFFVVFRVFFSLLVTNSQFISVICGPLCLVHVPHQLFYFDVVYYGVSNIHSFSNPLSCYSVCFKFSCKPLFSNQFQGLSKFLV